MEPVTTDPKGESFTTGEANTSALATKQQLTDMAWYVTGFVDGEGSFLVSFSKRPSLKTGLEVRPSLSVSQHKRNLRILQRIQALLCCGGIRFDQHDQTYKFEVRSLHDLSSKVIPYFRKYPLQTTKAQDFERFVDICLLMKANRHRVRDGLEQILSIAYSMNNLGARRQSIADLLQVVGKMKV